MTTATSAELSADELEAVANGWLREFAAGLGAADAARVSGLFLEEGWWRDLLAITWDFTTWQGAPQIARGLAPLARDVGVKDVRLSAQSPLTQQTFGGRSVIQVFFDFETSDAVARGLVRLVEEATGTWRAWTVLTEMEEISARTPSKARDSDPDRPDVIVVGAGQCGLAVAARLARLGLSVVALERNARVGDNWRQRYPTLTLHDPSWCDHLPYKPFPEEWPEFMPRDVMADWLEEYPSSMGINVVTSAVVEECAYDDGVGEWVVRVRAGGEEQNLRARHVVVSTGLWGSPRIPQYPGMDEFQGTIIHASQFRGARAWAGKDAVVMGAGSSAHDISMDFALQGASSVTMLQRSPTLVLSSARFKNRFTGLYRAGLKVDDADLVNASTPYKLVLDLHVAVTKADAEADVVTLNGLTESGFGLDFGPNGSGVFGKALIGMGGTYIDVGCSQLIIDGAIKVKREKISGFTKDGILFEDGTQVHADVVVTATGYTGIIDAARSLLGEEIVNRCNMPIYGLGADGEMGSVWRGSGVPGLWFAAGPLVSCRLYSKFLALQISAVESGLLSYGDDDAPAQSPRNATV